MNKDIKDLLKKFRESTLNKEEKALLENWVLFGEFNERELSDEELDAELYKVTSGLPLVMRQSKLWPRIAAIAAAVAAIVFCIWFYTSRHLEGSAATGDLLNYANDIAPGGNKATLSVDGKTIQLSENKTGVIVSNDLKYNDGTALGSFANNEAAIKNITASTPRGGMYQITLPDGTRAWLNADTKISFPAQFMGKEREILLSGEAYFEVTKNKEKPFVVVTDKQEVTVLGTHFNISAYKDENSVRTTLLEGSVRVNLLPTPTLSYSRNDVVLKPNQQSTVTESSGISIKEVDATDIIAWKNSYFRFTNEQIESVMAKLARWYNIDVEYQGSLPEERFNAAISRDKNISQILKVLEKTNAVHFKIEGRKVTVMK